MEHLSDKVAVITGGASGIGFATARRLASRGVRLVLADIEESALDRAATELAATGTAVEGVVCDVGDLKAVQHLADTAFEKMGAVHIVFHNAGVAVGGPIAEMQHSDWEWTMRVNLWGPIHGVEAFTQRMIAQGQGGHMLFTASFAGLVPNVGLGPYCVSKYGVVGFSRSPASRAASTRHWRIGPVPDAGSHQYRALGAQSPRRTRGPGSVTAGARPGRGQSKSRRSGPGRR